MITRFTSWNGNPFISHSTIHMFTDGSKGQIKIAAAAVITYDVFSGRLSDEATIYTTEAKAIRLGYEYLNISNDNHFGFFSNSLSYVQSISSVNIGHPYNWNILNWYYLLTKQGKIVAHVKDHTRLTRERSFPWIWKEGWAHWVLPWKLEHSQLNIFQFVNCSKIAEILPNGIKS